MGLKRSYHHGSLKRALLDTGAALIGEVGFGGFTMREVARRAGVSHNARDADLAHLPAWRRFRQSIGNSGDVGIWHETYMISEGHYENIYHNMPPFGLGRVGQLVEATGERESAAKRMHVSRNPAAVEAPPQ